MIQIIIAVILFISAMALTLLGKHKLIFVPLVPALLLIAALLALSGGADARLVAGLAQLPLILFLIRAGALRKGGEDK